MFMTCKNDSSDAASSSARTPKVRHMRLSDVPLATVGRERVDKDESCGNQSVWVLRSQLTHDEVVR